MLAVFMIREQEHKSSISKKYRTETLGLKIEVYHLVLVSVEERLFLEWLNPFAFHSCVMSVSYLLFFSLTIRELANKM